MNGLESRGNDLFFYGYDLKGLALKFDTPFFLFSEKSVRDNFQTLKSAFTKYYEKVSIDYSVKTNNELAVLEILQEIGSGAEISSAYELCLTEKAGFRGEQICFDGPCKPEEDIKFAIDKNVRIFNLDAIEDLEVLNNIAKAKNKVVKITFRIYPEEKGFMNKISQLYISKFGIPLSEARNAYHAALNFKNLKPSGISVHIGSQVTSINAYIETLKKLMKLAKELEGLGIVIEEINLGGGFPVMTLQKSSIPKLVLSQLGFEYKTKVPPIADFGSAISREFSRGVSGLRSKPVLVLEPGRSIISDAGILISRVKVIKKKWIFLDASINFVPEMIFFAQRDILLANKIKYKATKTYNIAGKSLNSADVFHLNKRLPQPQINDIAVILDAGAYTISRANRFTTLSPPVYLINKANSIQLIRRREEFQDVVAPMISARNVNVNSPEGLITVP